MSTDSTLTTPGRAVHGAGAYRVLVVYSPEGKHTGVTVALGGKAATIGRSPDEAGPLGFGDAEVSRAHAVFEPHEGGWRIRDLDSHNGTFVDGVRIGTQDLVNESVIRTGSHLMIFQYVSIEAARRLERGPRGDSSLIGDSVTMRMVREAVRKAGPEREPVLVLGESGTGKELIAKEIHRASGREGDLVAVNCAALPENLVESELFGHAKGAFTGASGPAKGLFREADGGTLFLDEIGEMPPFMQAKLLRALATGEIRPVGESRTQSVDVRVVAATNVDLEAGVDDNSFRGDLYARLMGITIQAPPLRARREDILTLTDHFLAEGGRSVRVTADAAEALLVDPWRFNVRQLEQTIAASRSAAREAGVLDLDQLPATVRKPAIERQSPDAPTAPEELPISLRVRQTGTPSASDLIEVFQHYGGNVAHVAEFFGKNRRQIYRWCERLDVDPESFREEE